MRRLLMVLVLCALPAFAQQVVPERELEIIQSLYDTGKYEEARRRATETLGLANFTEVQRVRLHELAALSAFNLGDSKGAQTAFLQLLRVNPDFILDPFAVPPPAIKLFEQVRRDNADALNLVRQQIALRLEQDKRAAAERERLRLEQEERRRNAELLSNEIKVRTIEKRSMIVNLLPFGTGQFQQGRTGWGAAFAISQGLLVVLNIVSYFAIEALIDKIDITFEDVKAPDGSGKVIQTVRGIPASRRTERDVWSGLKYGTGIAFYTLWAVGVGDALWRHEDVVITETREKVNQPAPAPSARLRIFPTPGGLGAGVTIKF